MTFTPALDSRDLDEARERIARSYCPHRLDVRGDVGGFRARHAAVEGPGVGLFDLSYGAAEVDVRPVPFRDFLLVSRPLQGELGVGGPGGTTVLRPGRPFALDARSAHRLRFGPGCRLLTVKVPVATIELALAADERPVDVRGLGGAPRDPAPWDAVTRFLRHEVIPHDLLAEGSPMRRHVAQLVAAGLVAAFHRHDDGRSGGRPQDRVRVAVDYIEAHAHLDIGVLDIAGAAGVGVRALQKAFHAELGSTPLAVLRRTRLAGVRRELRAGGVESVAAVAHRWGFGHLGRFAGEYRAAFGCLPSADRGRV